MSEARYRGRASRHVTANWPEAGRHKEGRRGNCCTGSPQFGGPREIVTGLLFGRASTGSVSIQPPRGRRAVKWHETSSEGMRVLGWYGMENL